MGGPSVWVEEVEEDGAGAGGAEGVVSMGCAPAAAAAAEEEDEEEEEQEACDSSGSG